MKHVLCKSFHLLSAKIARCTQEIESLLSKWDAMKEAEGWEIEYACVQYDIIISEVTKELEQFRKRHTSQLFRNFIVEQYVDKIVKTS